MNIAHAITISMNIPGASTTATSSPGAFITNFYQFSLLIGGVLAFGIIVFGGVKYMTSAGNPSGQGDAKEWIQAALLGLLLLVGAYFILDIINPQLLNLGLPALAPVNVAATGAGGCSNITCGSGYLPTTVGGAGTPEPVAQCVCQNATGAQGCGGAVAGTDPNSCGAGNQCVEISQDPVTYGCQASAQYDCGVPPNNPGKCANPSEQCEPYTIAPGKSDWECQFVH